jgi:hypothetical protein
MTSQSVFQSLADRDGMLQSGMEGELMIRMSGTMNCWKNYIDKKYLELCENCMVLKMSLEL